MAVTTAFSTALDELGRRVPGLLIKFTGTATTGGLTLTTTNNVITKGGASVFSSTEYLNRYLYIPTGSSAADLEHGIDSHSVTGGTATITTRGANYGATYTAATMYILALPIADLLSIANAALSNKSLLCETRWPLISGPTDGEMQATVDTDWTEHGAAAADDKQVTASEVLWGLRSMAVTAAVAGGGTASAVNRMGQSESGTLWAVAKADTDDAIIRIEDQSGNLLESVTFTQEEWLVIKKQFTLESDDEGVIVDLTGEDATSVTDYQLAGFVKHSQKAFKLPTWIRNQSEVKAIARVELGAAGREQDTWLFEDIDYTALKAGGDYVVERRYGDANPFWVQFTEEYMGAHKGALHVIDARVPYDRIYNDGDSITVYTSVARAPFLGWVAAMQHVLGTDYPEFGEQRLAGAERLLEHVLEDYTPEPPKRVNVYGGAFR